MGKALKIVFAIMMIMVFQNTVLGATNDSLPEFKRIEGKNITVKEIGGIQYFYVDRDKFVLNMSDDPNYIEVVYGSSITNKYRLNFFFEGVGTEHVLFYSPKHRSYYWVIRFMYEYNSKYYIFHVSKSSIKCVSLLNLEDSSDILIENKYDIEYINGQYFFLLKKGNDTNIKYFILEKND